MLDDRLLRVTIRLGRTDDTPSPALDSEVFVFERLAISAIGTKHASQIQNFAEVSIANVDKALRDKLLSEGTPFSRARRAPKNSILIEAGRKSTKLSQVFEGDIISVGVTQPPDISIVIRALTGQFRKYQTVNLAQNASAKFSVIAKQIAGEMGLRPDFRDGITDKSVANFSFSGALEKMFKGLGEIVNGVDAYVDDDRLVVQPRASTTLYPATEISITKGLVGIPEFVDYGIRCTVFMDQKLVLGDDIILKSEAYPAASGRYQIFRLGFNLTNRDTPFYYIIEAARKDQVSPDG